MDKISFFMDECKRMGIKVLGPDINESIESFTSDKEGNVRFGLAAVKGVGEAAMQSSWKSANAAASSAASTTSWNA